MQGNFGVSGGGRTVTVPAGEDGATLTIATTDGDGEDPGSITARVDRPDGYARGTPNSAVIRVAAATAEEGGEETPESAGQVSGRADANFAPANFTVASIPGSGVRFGWAAPGSGGSVRQYQVRWDRDADPSDGGTFTRSTGSPY